MTNPNHTASPTDCKDQPLLFPELTSRPITVDFDAGHVSSDGGGLLLARLDRSYGYLHRFARNFTDHRDPELIEHSLLELLRQRVYGLALGYEDLNDHDRLCVDPLLASLCGKQDPLGQNRHRAQDKGKALSGKSTLNRLELTPADADASDGALEKVKKIVRALRKKFPQIKIRLRGDSGFCRDALMTWCELSGVKYLLGLARNAVLERKLQSALEKARQHSEASEGKPARVLVELTYRAEKWHAPRWVIGKAEWTQGQANPRFILTNENALEFSAQELYEKDYCGRGDMENRIKEQQLDLYADRTSTGTMRSNQLRLWFSTLAYLLMNQLRRVGLPGTELARATCGTLRTRLLKIGALVRVSVRRVRVSLSSAWPLRELFARVAGRLQIIPSG